MHKHILNSQNYPPRREGQDSNSTQDVTHHASSPSPFKMVLAFQAHGS